MQHLTPPPHFILQTGVNRRPDQLAVSDLNVEDRSVQILSENCQLRIRQFPEIRECPKM